jgi:AP-3 complex subunit mu
MQYRAQCSSRERRSRRSHGEVFYTSRPPRVGNASTSVENSHCADVDAYSASPALGPSNNLAAALKAGSNLNAGPAIPWRRQNVRHTSNELYVDILENISVILAPSGRPISAISSGSIAFTAKISGVPDLLLALSAPGGSSIGKASGIARTMQSPVFHPCVRLARWKERPGELSFVPPDGRFVLAGYEVDLLPSYSDLDKPPNKGEKLFMPATADLRTCLGDKGSDFEVRLILDTNFPGAPTSSKAGASSGRGGTSTPSFSFGGPSSGSSNAPSLEAVVITIPFPASVRSVTDLRPSRGEAQFRQFDHVIEWKVPTKDGASVNGVAVLSGTLIGPVTADDDEEGVEDAMNDIATTNPLLGYYDEHSARTTEPSRKSTSGKGKEIISTQQLASQQKKFQANKALMPRSVIVSFTIRGWLPSGIKVDSLVVDSKRSKGLGEGVKPYKGVKYLTVSRKGVERRA